MASLFGGQPREDAFFAADVDPGSNTIKLRRFHSTWKTWFATAHQVLFNQAHSDTTANRPTSSNYVGRRFFDTTLGKPIWVKTVGPPAVWVDGVGTVS